MPKNRGLLYREKNSDEVPILGQSSHSSEDSGEQKLENLPELKGKFYIYSVTRDRQLCSPPEENWQEADFTLKKTGKLEVVKRDREALSLNIKRDYNYTISKVGKCAMQAFKPTPCELEKDDKTALVIPHKRAGELEGVSINLWLYFRNKKGLIRFVDYLCKVVLKVSIFDSPSVAEMREIREIAEKEEGN